jgi:hypothetical protein
MFVTIKFGKLRKISVQCQLREKKHQYFSIASLSTDSLIVGHAVFIVFRIVFCTILSRF